MLGHSALNLFDRNRSPSFLLQNVLEQMLDDFAGKLFATERSERRHPHERAFQATNVAANAVGQEFENLVRQFDLHPPRFFPENGKARLDCWRLQLRSQAPLKTRHQPMLEIRDLRGRPVGREDDLLVSVEERIERVKKFLLRTFFAAEKLNVVNTDQIGLAITLPEFDQIVVLNRVDEFVDEKLARKINHLGVF